VVDWIDTDVDALIPDGAEDDYYTGLDTAYRAANAPFASVSELQLVKGFSFSTAYFGIADNERTDRGECEYSNA